MLSVFLSAGYNSQKQSRADWEVLRGKYCIYEVVGYGVSNTSLQSIVTF